MITSQKEKGLAVCKSPGRKNNQLLGKEMFWARRVHSLAKEQQSSGLQATSQKPSDTGHNLYNFLSLTPVSENSSGVYALREWQRESPNDIKVWGEWWRWHGQDKEPPSSLYLEDMKCKGFRDSLKSVFVRHQRDQMLAMRIEPQRRLHSLHIIIKISKSGKSLKQLCEVDKSYCNRRP